MSDDINREERKKQTQEYFTQKREIDEILSHWSDEEILRNETFLDSSCGSGNILNAVLQVKLDIGIPIEDALASLYGVDYQISNVDECRQVLLRNKNDPTLIAIVEQNIQCRDALKFGYNFEPMGPARRNTEDKARAKQQRLKAKQEKLAKEEARKKKDEKIFAKNFEVLELPVTFE